MLADICQKVSLEKQNGPLFHTCLSVCPFNLDTEMTDVLAALLRVTHLTTLKEAIAFTSYSIQIT